MTTPAPTFTRQRLPLASLHPWSINPRGDELRGIPEFAAQLTEDGEIREDLHAFNLNGLLTLMAGHRRLAAGRLAGFDEAWVKVWNFTDEREAFKHLLTLQNGTDPFDAREMAKAAGSALQMGIPKEELQGVMHRSEETVQLYLDLNHMPGQVQDWVWERKLPLGTASLLRKLPKDKQLEAARECVNGVLFTEPMSEAQAERHLKEKYLKPAEWLREWQGLEPKLKRKLRVADGYHYVAFEDRGTYCQGNGALPMEGYAHADEYIAEAELINPREPMNWGELARRHSAPIYVVPAPSSREQHMCVVMLKMLRDAEQVADSPVLKSKVRPPAVPKVSFVNLPESEEEEWQTSLRQEAEESPEREEEEDPYLDDAAVMATLTGVHERLLLRPDLALRDGCFRPLLPRVLEVMRPALPEQVFKQLLRIYTEEASGARKGLRWFLLLALAAELCQADDKEVTAAVMTALAEKAG